MTTASAKELIRTYDPTADRRQAQAWMSLAVDTLKRYTDRPPGVTDRLRIDVTGPQGSGKTTVAGLLRDLFDRRKSASLDQVVALRHLLKNNQPVIYDDGVPEEYDADKALTPLQCLREFVVQYEEGAQGAMMDHESAQILALAIKHALGVTDKVFQTAFLLKHGRAPTEEEMGL